MNQNERTFKEDCRRAQISAKRFTRLLIFCIICGSALCGCRSVSTTHSGTGDTVWVQAAYQAATDTLSATAAAVQTDTLHSGGQARETGSISIVRDSVGLPVRIFYSRSLDFQNQADRSRFEDLRITGFHSAGAHQDSRALEHVNQTQKEKQTETDASLPLEKVLGIPLLFFAIIYVGYSLISNFLK